MRGVLSLNLNNKYFFSGLLFILVGYILWNYNIISIDLFFIFRLFVSIGLIFYGIKTYKYYSDTLFGKIIIAIGIVLFLSTIGVKLKVILSVCFTVFGIYFLFIKSKLFKVFIVEKGIFKDSRNQVYIKEGFSSIRINNTSNNLSSVKVKAYFSNINLDFSNSNLGDNKYVDFEVLSLFSKVSININYDYNVKVNGEYVRNNRVSGKDFDIKSTKLFGSCDIL